MAGVGKLIRITLRILTVTILCTAVNAETTKEFDELVKWYRTTYDFMTMEDSLYTFESEFIMPDSYQRPDPTQMSPFATWVSRFPLWHEWKAVGMWRGQKTFAPDEICRVIHLPWRGPTYTEDRIPFRILAEYLRQNGREFDFVIQPRAGEALSYENWLEGRPVFSAQGAVSLKPAAKRDTSAAEYFALLQLAAKYSDYKSLAANCVTVSDNDLLPGDLLIGHDDSGMNGRVFVIMNMIVNDDGHRLYAVGTGCDQACDFHIPLVNSERDNPWLDLERVKALIEGQTVKGFYRFKLVADGG